ncbi:unnamed protein product [Ambrosiozyma monospora]|uniref:Unnamed protein product n=1 Tax=Ambrosiozyma monospora TaxID=43982 RepID=A0ACB5U428_AMBMO|nr:unnamed protein product [Ambrosiozyma monospora]
MLTSQLTRFTKKPIGRVSSLFLSYHSFSKLTSSHRLFSSTALTMSLSADSINPKNYYADTKAPIARLSAKKYFEQLTQKEQLYAHYFSKAGHWGSRAVLRSVSPESEDIFDLILSINKAVKGDYSAISKELGEEKVKSYLEYASQFLGNLGNYKSFGDVKFIPRLSKGDFETLVELTNDETSLQLFEQTKYIIYSLTDKTALLGSPEQGHVTGYYLNLVTKAEGEAVDSALAN